MSTFLTFGIELEFTIKDDPGPRIANSDPGTTEWEYFAEAIENKIRENGISNVRTFQTPGIADYRNWCVKDEITAPNPKQTSPEDRWYGFEISSPILDLDSGDWAQKVAVACQSVRDACLNVEIHDTCGLHVHVGKGSDGDFTEIEIKNLFAMLWAFEQRFEDLHPPHRNSQCDENKQYKGMRNKSQLASKTNTLDQALQKIYSCQSKDEVIELVNTPEDRFNTHRYWAYSAFNAHSDNTWPGKKTIEFRQHKGTLEVDEIKPWVMVCVRLVRFAQNHSGKELVDFLLSHETKAFTAIDMIRHIGLLDEAAYYQRTINARSGTGS